MKEIEVKILEINKEEIVKKLTTMGAEKIFDGNIEASFFDFEDRRFLKKEKLLRLRKKGEIIELTFKRKVSKEKVKIMQEYEIYSNDYDTTKKILTELGLKEFDQISKHRVSYVLDNVHFEIDTLPNIPTFLEIEAPTLKDLEKYVEKFGFSISDTKPWSWEDVLKYYEKKQKAKNEKSSSKE